MKTENMRASTNVEDRRDEPMVYKRKQFVKELRDEAQKRQEQTKGGSGSDLPSGPGKGGTPQPHAGDDDTLNPQLLRPPTSQAIARSRGFDPGYQSQRVRPIPELSMQGIRDEEDASVPTMGYAKGGPVTGAKKIRNKGYRPF